MATAIPLAVVAGSGAPQAVGAAPFDAVSSDPVSSDAALFDTKFAYQPLVPVRLLDSRIGLGAPEAPVGPSGVIDLQVAGSGGVPATGVGAVVLNVTASQPTAKSFVTVWPTGEDRPTASSLNMDPGQNVPNLVIAKLGENGKVSMFNNFGSTHLIADVTGWFPTGSTFDGSTPTRILDSRIGLGAPEAPVGPSGVIDLQVAGSGGVPATGVGAVVLNVTAVRPTSKSFVTVWPTGEDRPTASSLNMDPGQNVPNLVIAKLGENGKVSMFNNFGSTHLIADVMGVFPAGGQYQSVTPARVKDSRDDKPIGEGGQTTITFDSLPAAAVAVAINVTIARPTARTFITAWPSDAERPVASNLNAAPGDTRANLVIARLSDDGKVSLFNSFGESHLIVDLIGWFGSVELSVDPGLSPVEPFLDTPDQPLARMAGDESVADFVSNELLVSGPKSVADEIAEGWNGTVVSTTPPAGQMPGIHVVRFDLTSIDPPPASESYARLEDTAWGNFAVSTEAAAKLIALGAHLLGEGYAVSVNVVLEDSAGYQDETIREEVWDQNRNGIVDGSESTNAFDWSYLREGGGADHGFTSAWKRLDGVGRLEPAVKVAVFDGGFDDSTDQQNVTLIGTTHSDENLLGCGSGNPCPWHGTAVTDTIIATHGNGRGTAGAATPVVTETIAIGLGRSWRSYVSGLGRVMSGSLGGVDIINVSGGGGIPWALAPFAKVIIEPIGLLVRALGTQIVASAGNSGDNVDGKTCFFKCWESTYHVPCEVNGVLCVGGLNDNTNTHHDSSNYGSGDVDIWAPWTVHTGPAPDRTTLASRTVGGTSFSAPLTSAAVALVMAADPRLSGVAAGRILMETARQQPSESRARRILDVQAAVNTALNRAGSAVTIVKPDDRVSVGFASNLRPEALQCCSLSNLPTSYTWREGPSGGSLTTVATGRTPTIRMNRGVGQRQLSVTARWPSGTQRTDTINVTVTNIAPTVTIQRPSSGESFFESSTIPLRATASDIDGYGNGIPSSFITWRIDGSVVGTGLERTVNGLAIGSHTAQISVTDGNLTTVRSASFTVVADPPNLPPSAVIVAPTSGGLANTSTPSTGYAATARATASDPTGEPLTVKFYSKLDGGAEVFLGDAVRTTPTGSTYELPVFFAWDPPAGCFAGTPYELILEVSDGTTTVSDSADIVVTLIC